MPSMSRQMKPRTFNRGLCRKLGRRICRRREELGLTQRGLAKLANVTNQRHVLGIEHGENGITVETARRLAQALGWSLSEWFKGL